MIWNRDGIVALCKKHGYNFTRHDLDGFIRKGRSLLAVAGAMLLAFGVSTVS